MAPVFQHLQPWRKTLAA